MGEPAKVIQRDRDMAANYLSYLGYIAGREKDAILRGKWDKKMHVRWFAEHREYLATTAQPEGSL